MSSTPRSTTRRSSAIAAARSGGSPHTPGPVTRMAPKPMRPTVMSPIVMASGRVVAISSGRRLSLALDLGPVHHAALGLIERVAPVHGAAIVPQDQVADAPAVRPDMLRPVDHRPDLVQHALGLGQRQTRDVG